MKLPWPRKIIENICKKEKTKSNIEVKNQEFINQEYNRIYNNELKVKIINKFFNNEKMLKTFPRLTIQNINGDIINIRDIYPDILTLKHLEKLKNLKKFIPYFDIPLQHINPKVLKRM